MRAEVYLDVRRMATGKNLEKMGGSAAISKRGNFAKGGWGKLAYVCR